MYWLGIDVGTGGARALLVDGAGRVRAAATAPHEPVRMERPLWAEQRPEDWWRASIEAIRAALAEAGVSGKDVRGVGLSGQMHGLALLDESGDPVRPALIWCDQRSQPQVDFINRTAGADFVLQSTANPVLTGFTLPKLLWVRDHEPRIFERARKLLLPKDYIRYRLTGEFASDVSDASGTSLFDVVRRRWSLEMTQRLGLDRSLLPDVAESCVVTACIASKAANLTGLSAGTPVAAGAGDQAASAVGAGIVRSGVVSCTLGTSGVVFAHMEQPAYDPAGRVHTFCHAVPDCWHVMGVTQGAGLSLQWFRDQMCAAGVTYDDLTREAARAAPGAQGLYWLPYLMGERTPHLDAWARGGWIGLTARHTRGDLIRALIEGVCYSQKDCLEIVEQLGAPVAAVRVSGGGARSAFWRQTLANVFGKPVVALETEQGSAYGAALLALVATGEFSSVAEVCGTAVREAETIDPEAGQVQAYAERHAIYQSLYPALRPFYRILTSGE